MIFSANYEVYDAINDHGGGIDSCTSWFFLSTSILRIIFHKVNGNGSLIIQNDDKRIPS